MKNLTPGVYEFDYLLENKFFVDIDGDQVQKGKVQVHLTLKRSSMSSELDFHSEGVVMVPCDRCLDDMEQPIETDNRLIVKFGSEYAEESDEVLIIPEDDGTLNIAWFLYEFIALAIPMKHVHAPGNATKPWRQSSSNIVREAKTMKKNWTTWTIWAFQSRAGRQTPDGTL